MRKFFKTILASCFLLMATLPVLAQEKNSTVPERADNMQIIDDSQVEGEAGTYPVVISYSDENGETTSAVVYITVYRMRTVENKEAKELIDAVDLEINQGYFNKLTDEDLLLLTKAKAWNGENGKPIPITHVKRKKIDAKDGRYQVIYSTEKGTSVTINIFESSVMQPYEQKDSYFQLTYNGKFLYLETLVFTLLLSTIGIVVYFVFRVQKASNAIYRSLYKTQNNIK